MDLIDDPELFRKFHGRLVSYLDIKDQSDPVESQVTNGSIPPSSPQSQLEPGTKKPLPKKKHPKKPKQTKIRIVKAVTKSAEQISQEAEMRRLADRERVQRKRGDIVTTAPDGRILVNKVHKLNEDSVWLHPKLAASMKPHQMQGLEFMWRQVIDSAKLISF
jgi:hypothetical protein